MKYHGGSVFGRAIDRPLSTWLKEVAAWFKDSPVAVPSEIHKTFELAIEEAKRLERIERERR